MTLIDSPFGIRPNCKWTKTSRLNRITFDLATKRGWVKLWSYENNNRQYFLKFEIAELKDLSNLWIAILHVKNGREFATTFCENEHVFFTPGKEVDKVQRSGEPNCTGLVYRTELEQLELIVKELLVKLGANLVEISRK